MSKDEDAIYNFIEDSEKIKKYFNFEGDFFIKPLLDCKWKVVTNNDISILTYIKNDGKKIDCVVVQKNNKPIIFENVKFTMILAIDCVKISFIFDSDNKL